MFQRYDTIAYPLPVHLHPGDTVLATVRVLHCNAIDCLSVAIAEAETWPACRDNRINPHLVTADLHTQNLFHPGPIHPSRRTGIPGPAPLAYPAG